jgi:hypothetical protein
MNGKSEETSMETHCPHCGEGYTTGGKCGLVEHWCPESAKRFLGANIFPSMAPSPGPSLDTHVICDKLDFLGRLVVAAIIRASSRDPALSSAQASLADADAILTAESLIKILQGRK